MFNFVADVVEEITPSVVSIIEKEVYGHYFFGPPKSSGSGFLVDSEGHIITNAHVVRNSTQVNVLTSDGRTFLADVLAIHSSNDLALLKIRGSTSQVTSLPYLPFANIEEPDKVPVRPGEFVLAAGSPLQLQNTVTFGVVSAVERDLGTTADLKYIQTDATITFGNSGGPLINLNGEVVGVNTMIAGAGLGFSIPVNSVVDFYHKAKLRIAEKSRMHPQIHTDTGMARNTRYLGVVLATVKLDDMNGVQIRSVMNKSPAQKAGLQPGDIIININGKSVNKAKDLLEEVSGSSKIVLSLVRNGKTLEICVSPEDI